MIFAATPVEINPRPLAMAAMTANVSGTYQVAPHFTGI